MWKRVVIAMMLCMPAVMLSADDQGFLGIEAKYHGLDAQEPVTGKDFSESSWAAGFRAGAQNEKFRFFLMYDFIDDVDRNGVTISQYLFSGVVDWFVPVDTTRAKPYLGAIVGYGSYEYGSYDDTGMAYGAEGGVLFDLSRRFQVDGFVRWIGSDIDRVNSYIQAGIGIDYKF